MKKKTHSPEVPGDLFSLQLLHIYSILHVLQKKSFSK